MLSNYAFNSKINGWWNEVEVMIWGKSAMLTIKDEEVRAELRDMIGQGIKVRVSRECAEKLNATEIFTEMGVEVSFLGEELTRCLKLKEPLLTI